MNRGSHAVLEERLARFDEVLFAFLFGSRAVGKPRPDSDWDIGVYVSEALTAEQRFDLRRLAAGEKEAFLADDIVRASAERWLQLAAECCLDLAHHLIADRGWKTPSTYREAFEILHKENVLDSECARQMEQWAGLRNVLVHVYLDVESERLYQILQEDLDQLERFAAQISRAAD